MLASITGRVTLAGRVLFALALGALVASGPMAAATHELPKPAVPNPAVAKPDVWGRSLAEWAGDLVGPVEAGHAFGARLTAVRALGVGGAKSQKHLAALLALLDPELAEPDTRLHEYLLYALRVDVADSIARIGPRVLPALAQALAKAAEEERPTMRAGVAFAIGEFHHSAAEIAQALEAALARETDPLATIWLRCALAGAVADPTPHVEALVEGLEAARRRSADEGPTEQAHFGDAHFQIQGALIAFGRLGPSAAAALPKLEAWRDTFGTLEALLSATILAVTPPGAADEGDRVDALVTRLIAESNYMPTQHAVRILGERIIEPLLEAARDPIRAGEQRIACAWMLNWIGVRGIDALGRLASDHELAISMAALSVLQSVSGPEHITALVPALGVRHDVDSRQLLGTAFGFRGGAVALEALHEALESRSTTVQVNALRCLVLLAAYSPGLEDWKKVERTVDRLQRSRDEQVKLEAGVTGRAINNRAR